jgi:2-aminoadipate transaminase
MQSFVSPGDVVLVESPLWTIQVNFVAQFGATAVSVAADCDGISLSDIEREIAVAKRAGKRIKAIYVQPIHHNPTGVTITRDRAERLLRLAAENGIIIISDEPYEAYWFQEQPCYLSALSGGVGVFTVHTFSKTLGTGLRLGYVHSAEEWLAPIRQLMGSQASVFLEYGVGALMASGRFDQIVAGAKNVYARKMKIFCDAIEAHAGRHLALKPAQNGGFFIWLELERLPAVEVNLQLLARGVEARVGKNMHGPKHQELRTNGEAAACHIGFAYIGPSEAQLVEAAQRFGAACDALEVEQRFHESTLEVEQRFHKSAL